MPVPITFHLTEKDIEARVNELIGYIDYTYDLPSLKPYLLANVQGFQNNQVQHDWTNGNKRVSKGSKLIKSFKHFTDGRALDDIQTRASQIIQENVITGTLCFSVHPLDYLSSSENTYNWRSCHALDGEYRAGNLSYMLDSSTVVCYLKGSNNVKLPLFPDDVPWNSKKWRVLFYVSDNWDIIFAGRQYPFSSSKGIETARQYFLNEALHKRAYDYCAWTDPVITEVPDSYGHSYNLNSQYIMVRGMLHSIHDLVIDGDNSLHFNDVLRSSFYRPHYTAINNRPWFKEPISKVHVGKSCNCLRCGKAPIKIPETFMCDSCDLEYGEFNEDIYTICDCCGRRIYIEDATTVDGEEICEDCVKNECFLCECCDEIHFNDTKVYVEVEDAYYCSECAENREDD